jgi:hypothetical protein
MPSEEHGNLISFGKSKMSNWDGGNPRKCHLKVEHSRGLSASENIPPPPPSKRKILVIL